MGGQLRSLPNGSPPSPRAPTTECRCCGRSFAVLGVAAIVVLLTACGIDGDDDAPPAATAPTDVLSIVTPTPGTPPPRAAAPAPAVGQQTYVVREGDSLSVIAERFGVTQDAIQRANDITDANSLFAGQEIVIPAPEP